MKQAALEHLSREDAQILGLEAGPVAGHILKVIVAERPRSGDPLAALRQRVASGLAAAPRAAERLMSTPLGLAPPAWVPDPDFDLSAHVRRAPYEPVDREAFVELVARAMAERLDRRRPLWTIELVEGLEGDRVAYLFKIHHCMADGMGSLRLAAALLWEEAPVQAPRSDAAPPRPARLPGRVQLLASGARERLRNARATAVAAAKTTLSSTLRRSEEAKVARIPAAVRRELSRGQEHSPLGAPVGRARKVAFVAWSLDDLKRIGHAHGATVNDVLLATVAGGLRGWLAARGDHVPDIRIKVPVSMHHGDEGPAALGNRDSFFIVDLPLAEPDAVRRLDAVRSETARRKREHDAEALYLLFNDLAHVSGGAYRRANALADSPGVFSLCVSNVPGPSTPRYVLGEPVSEVHSLAEVGDRHGLRVSAISSAGELSLGLCGDAHAVGDLQVLATAMRDAIAELSRAV
jgi:diacylglycerol O-acyltransferase / wax synthase